VLIDYKSRWIANEVVSPPIVLQILATTSATLTSEKMPLVRGLSVRWYHTSSALRNDEQASAVTAVAIDRVAPVATATDDRQ
jgi:hypothetical protein